MNATAAYDEYAKSYYARHGVEYSVRLKQCRASLAAYVAKRRAKGDTVDIVDDAYISGPYARAKLLVNGKTRRVYAWAGVAVGETWRYA